MYIASTKSMSTDASKVTGSIVKLIDDGNVKNNKLYLNTEKHSTLSITDVLIAFHEFLHI